MDLATYTAERLNVIKSKRLKRVLQVDTKEGCLTAFESEYGLSGLYEDQYDGSGRTIFKLGRWVKYEVPQKDIMKVNECINRYVVLENPLKQGSRSYTFEIGIDNNGEISYWFSGPRSSGSTDGKLTAEELKAVLAIVSGHKLRKPFIRP